MKLEQIERFLVVADCLNFTSAAEQLYVGQSTISRQIAALEDELGVQLMIRGPRTVQLTDAGRKLQSEGTKLLQYIEQIKKQVKEAGNGLSGVLKVSMIPAYIPALNEIQEYVAEKQPNFTLIFNQVSYNNIDHMLELGTVDIGVTYSFWDQKRPGFNSIELCEEHFVVVCSKHHWAAKKYDDGKDGYHPIQVNELRSEEFIFGRSGLYLVQHPLDFDNAAVRENNSIHASLEDMVMHMSSSDGIAILPSSACASFPRNLAQIPVADEELKHSLILLWKKSAESPALLNFLNIVDEWKKQKNTEQ